MVENAENLLENAKYVLEMWFLILSILLNYLPLIQFGPPLSKDNRPALKAQIQMS